MKKPELLAPAGNMEKLKTAVAYGADAVYLGGKRYSLRAFGGNFSDEEITEAAAFCHERGKKLYVAVNTYPRNDDFADLPSYIKFLATAKADAILVSDLGVFFAAKEAAPDLEIHISTQANTVNYRTAAAWANLGAKRIVLARELSLGEIKTIREKCGVELEIFVHGAMCMAYSGRCLLSAYLTGRDANDGQCAHPCRYKYRLVEETRPGNYFPVAEDEGGSYVFNSKDLCLLPYIKEIIECGIDSLKIEGRMKSVHYVASVVKTYRNAIDDFFAAPDSFRVKDDRTSELAKISHRDYTAGFFSGEKNNLQIYDTSSYKRGTDFVGIVRAYDEKTGFARVEQRGNMKIGQTIEILRPAGKNFRQKLSEMTDENGEKITAAPHAQQTVNIRMKEKVEPYAILRRDVT